MFSHPDHMPDWAPKWLEKNTFHHPTWSVDQLVAAKKGATVSVVMPALNEEHTVGDVVTAMAPFVGNLVDELVVVDSGSTDATREKATAAGATVLTREAALPGVDVIAGKGEVLWRSLAATSGDIVVFIDSDLIDPDPQFIVKLLGPLLTCDEVELVKGYYRRPLEIGGVDQPHGGGRVTELVARPLLSALCPQLSLIIQPLSGEYAARRDLLESLPFAPGYGVEIGLLVDAVKARGPHAIAQVNLGVRKHRNRPLSQLSAMSRQIITTLFDRVGVQDSQSALVRLVDELAEHDETSVLQPEISPLVFTDRPPMKHFPRP